MRVVGVRFKSSGKIYYFDPKNLELSEDDSVIVETTRGLEFAAVSGVSEITEDEFDKELKPVIRKATAEDIERNFENGEKEKEAIILCDEKIKKHNLEMKLVSAEYTFDGSKLLFYFTADGRIDFRDLVKDLATVFKTRIELRQIGVRDEAKMLGSIGVCGRNICCSQFLGDFIPVSIKMAKEQGLSLNPTKISGACGRLMCCLKYEQDGYEELLKKVPAVGAVVDTPLGEGRVENVSVLKQTVVVRIGDENQTEIQTFSTDEITVLKNNKNKIVIDDIENE